MLKCAELLPKRQTLRQTSQHQQDGPESGRCRHDETDDQRECSHDSEGRREGLVAQHDCKRSAADALVMHSISPVVDCQNRGCDGTKCNAQQDGVCGHSEGLQIVGSANRCQAEEDKHGQFTERRVGNGFRAAMYE